MTALNPVFTIGDQIAETLIVHGRATRREATKTADRAARRRSHSRRRIAGEGLSASAVGRDAAARADRDGARLPPIARDRRRTDDRARRDDPGADSRFASRDEGGVQPRRCCSSPTISASSPRPPDRVAVMYAGRIVEEGPVRAIFREPGHPYTRGLLASMPGGAPGQRLRAIEGNVPILGELPPGCAFNPRCPDRFEPCLVAPPPDYAGRRRSSSQVLSPRRPTESRQRRARMPLVEVSHLVKQFVRGGGSLPQGHPRRRRGRCELQH